MHLFTILCIKFFNTWLANSYELLLILVHLREACLSKLSVTSIYVELLWLKIYIQGMGMFGVTLFFSQHFSEFSSLRIFIQIRMDSTTKHRYVSMLPALNHRYSTYQKSIINSYVTSHDMQDNIFKCCELLLSFSSRRLYRCDIEVFWCHSHGTEIRIDWKEVNTFSCDICELFKNKG